VARSRPTSILYRRILTGSRRRKFDQTIKLDEERKLRVGLEQRIKLLEDRLLNEDHGANDSRLEEVAALKATSSQLEAARRQAEDAKMELVSMGADVVHSWGTTEGQFLMLQDLHLPALHFQIPDAITDQWFYDYAALLLPFSQWDENPRKSNLQTKMKKTLQVHVQDLLAEREDSSNPEVQKAVNAPVAIFNQLCDHIKEEEDLNTSVDEDLAQQWLDDQNALWEVAKSKVKQIQLIQQGWRAPVQLARIMHSFAHVVRIFAEGDAEHTTLQRSVRDTLRGAWF